MGAPGPGIPPPQQPPPMWMHPQGYPPAPWGGWQVLLSFYGVICDVFFFKMFRPEQFHKVYQVITCHFECWKSEPVYFSLKYRDTCFFKNK